MADYGVTVAGFKRKRLADIKLEIESSLRSNIGNFINLLPSSIFAQLIGIFSEREDSLWEVAEDVYNSQYLSSASGAPFLNVLGLLGVTKLQATKSVQRNLHLFGTVGAIIPVNTQVRVAGNPSSTFKTVASVQLVAGQDQIQRLLFSSTPTSGYYTLRYINEDTVSLSFNANAAAVQAALNALDKLGGVIVTGSFDVNGYFDVQFSGVNGKTIHPDLIVSASTLSNGATVTLAPTTKTQEAIPQGLVDAEALDYGPTTAPLYTLTEIVNPVTGLTSILNVEDADVGRYLEEDNAARLRSATAQAGRGKASPNAIKARLEELDGVSKAIVFNNDEDVADANGVPPHALRVYVQGGDDDDIRVALFDAKAGGIKTDGTVVGTITDDDGIVQTVKFSRPDMVPIYINIVVTKDPLLWPSNGAAQVRSALATYVNGLGIGSTVNVYPKMISALNSIPGITDIVIKVGKTSNPTSDDNVAIGIQQLAEVVNLNTDIVVTVQ